MRSLCSLRTVPACIVILLSGGAAAFGKPTSIIRSIDAANQLSGTWQIADRKLICEAAALPGKIKLAEAPAGDYSIRLEFTRDSGTGPVAITLPYSDGEFSFVLGGAVLENSDQPTSDGFVIGGNKTVGMIAGKDDKFYSIEGLKSVKIVIRIIGDTVEVAAKGKTIARYKDGLDNLTTCNQGDIGANHIGLVTWNARTTFSAVTVDSLEEKPAVNLIARPGGNNNAGAANQGISFAKGDSFKGEFTTSNTSKGTGGLTITSCNGNSYEGVLKYSDDRCWIFKFTAQSNGSIVVDKVQDRSRRGTRDAQNCIIRTDGSDLFIRVDFVYSDHKVKGNRGWHEFRLSKW